MPSGKSQKVIFDWVLQVGSSYYWNKEFKYSKTVKRKEPSRKFFWKLKDRIFTTPFLPKKWKIVQKMENFSDSKYRSGMVNSNTVNSKFRLIRSYCEIFFYHFSNIPCLKYTVNSNFHLIRSKTLPTNDFELTVPNLYVHWLRSGSIFRAICFSTFES